MLGCSKDSPPADYTGDYKSTEVTEFSYTSTSAPIITRSAGTVTVQKAVNPTELQFVVGKTFYTAQMSGTHFTFKPISYQLDPAYKTTGEGDFSGKSVVFTINFTGSDPNFYQKSKVEGVRN